MPFFSSMITRKGSQRLTGHKVEDIRSHSSSLILMLCCHESLSVRQSALPTVWQFFGVFEGGQSPPLLLTETNNYFTVQPSGPFSLICSGCLSVPCQIRAHC